MCSCLAPRLMCKTNDDESVTASLPCHCAEIMDSAMAAPEEAGLQPQPMSNWSAFFFFVAFVLVVGYTLLNLYIGVVFYQFSRIRMQSQTGSAFLTDDQTEWVEMSKLVLRLKPPEKSPVPVNKLRRWAAAGSGSALNGRRSCGKGQLIREHGNPAALPKLLAASMEPRRGPGSLHSSSTELSLVGPAARYCVRGRGGAQKHSGCCWVFVGCCERNITQPLPHVCNPTAGSCTTWSRAGPLRW